MARRERTRHLIELGGLVQKAKLVEASEDDRALLYGAFLDLADRLEGEAGLRLRILLRRRGTRAFAIEAREKDRQRAERRAGPR